MEKYCKKCDTTKPVSEFHKKAARKDGLASHCRQCNNRAEKERYKKNPERHKETRTAWRENNPDYLKKWREKNPDYYAEWRKNNPDYQKEYSAEYYEKNKERVKKNIAAWKEENPNYQIQYKYGLSQADYNKLLEDQDHVCAICGGDNNGKTLAVDHDHSCCKGSKSCGKCVRQLLCNNCNWMLGNAKDNPEILEAAKKYLERHSRSENLAKNLD